MSMSVGTAGDPMSASATAAKSARSGGGLRNSIGKIPGLFRRRRSDFVPEDLGKRRYRRKPNFGECHCRL